MQKRSLCLAVALWFVAATASALPSSSDVIVSGNGLLEFSNFQFFSPSHSVSASEVSATALANGILLSGPVDASRELRGFFVTYDVRALGPGINGVSLLLDSTIDRDANGFVLSTKRILGGPDPGGWDAHGPWKGDDRGRWDHGSADLDPHDFEFGDHRTLAFLKTVQWREGRGHGWCAHPSFGLGNDGAIRLAEAGFEAQQTLHVVEHVLVAGQHGTATWLSSANRFTVVPEPGTAALTLLGLGLLARRSRRSR